MALDRSRDQHRAHGARASATSPRVPLSSRTFPAKAQVPLVEEDEFPFAAVAGRFALHVFEVADLAAPGLALHHQPLQHLLQLPLGPAGGVPLRPARERRGQRRPIPPRPCPASRALPALSPRSPVPVVHVGGVRPLLHDPPRVPLAPLGHGAAPAPRRRLPPGRFRRHRQKVPETSPPPRRRGRRRRKARLCPALPPGAEGGGSGGGTAGGSAPLWVSPPAPPLRARETLLLRGCSRLRGEGTA